MPRLPRRDKSLLGCYQTGFTLVEVLLALLMFGIISAVIFTTFSAVVDGVEQGQESGEFYRVGRVALQHMAQEVSSAVLYEMGSDDPLVTQVPSIGIKGTDEESDGQPHDSIDFVTIPYRRFSLDVPTDEFCDIAYYIDKNEEGVSALFREDDCHVDEERRDGGTKLELAEDAVGLDITYFDTTDVYDEWPPDQGDEASLPCRVRLALTFQRPPKDARSFVTTVTLPMNQECQEEEAR
jgi:prepilin-type N-terminal cleavage/methylation domain-containing protein